VPMELDGRHGLDKHLYFTADVSWRRSEYVKSLSGLRFRAACLWLQITVNLRVLQARGSSPAVGCRPARD